MLATMGYGSLVVVMTDFGTAHWYDAAMKGEILRRAPDAKILDLSHDVPRHSIEQGAFMLQCAVDSFPKRTIFLCVVDPGVGTERKSLVGWVGEFGYVGPDNGLLTPLWERAAGICQLHEIKTSTWQNDRVSHTFNGRDIFAPAAARLLLGDDPRLAGPRVLKPVLMPLKVAVEQSGVIQAKVMMIDPFGNAITNIPKGSYGERFANQPFKLKVNKLELGEIKPTYKGMEPGSPLLYWGSSNYLEIAVNMGSAAETYAIKPGDSITIQA